MRYLQKFNLYFQTLRHLKLEQICQRLLFRLKRPQVDSRSAPEINVQLRRQTAFAAMTASALGKGTFRFLNETHTLTCAEDWNHSEWGKLWLYNLHYFDYLRQENLGEAAGNALISQWIAENPPGYGNGWEPYPLSLRIVNWIKWHMSGHKLSSNAINSLAIQCRFLTQRIERHLLANHFLANAKALTFGGMFFGGEEGTAFRNFGLAIYRRELPEQILADGGHFERSMMYHSIILEDLLDLKNIGAPIPELNDYIARMCIFLRQMTGADGQIALFNDAAFGIAVAPHILLSYAERFGIDVVHDTPNTTMDFPQTGYTRMECGPWVLFADTAPIGPEYQPGHAHADTLSFELFCKKKRCIIDSGTMQYIDGPVRQMQRSSAGHNVLVLDGENSSNVWGAHRVAERATIVTRTVAEGSVYATHDGYAPMMVGRHWTMEPSQVVIQDEVNGDGAHQVDLFFHFHPKCNVSMTNCNHALVCYDDCRITIALPDEVEWCIEEGICSFEFGILDKCTVLHGYKSKLNLPVTMKTTIAVKQ